MKILSNSEGFELRIADGKVRKLYTFKTKKIIRNFRVGRHQKMLQAIVE